MHGPVTPVPFPAASGTLVDGEGKPWKFYRGFTLRNTHDTDVATIILRDGETKPPSLALREIILNAQHTVQIGTPAGFENVDMTMSEVIRDPDAIEWYTFVEWPDDLGVWHPVSNVHTFHAFVESTDAVIRIGYADAIANPAAEEPDAGTIFTATFSVLGDTVDFNQDAILAPDDGPVPTIEAPAPSEPGTIIEYVQLGGKESSREFYTDGIIATQGLYVEILTDVANLQGSIRMVA